MTYEKLQEKITKLYLSLELSASNDEMIYYQREILVAEEVLQDTINKGRR